MNIQAGDTIATRYRILRLAGSGGFARVWEAEDTSLGCRRVAVKEMSLPPIDGEERRRATLLFRREVEALSSLSHPNLPAIYDGFTEDERYFIVLEFIDGEVLETWRELNKPEVSQILAWGETLADILAYVHGLPHPIIVRDLKPSNVMRSRGGQLRLIDLGISAILRPRGKDSATLAGFGTPGYAAPEQYGQRAVDARTDLYALGATLYFLLTGGPPADAIERLLGRKVLEPIAVTRPDVPAAVARWLEDSLLATDAARRPGSAAAVGDWLRRARAGQAVPSSLASVSIGPSQALEPAQPRLLSLAFAEDGHRLWSASPSEGLWLWDVDARTRLQATPSPRVTAVAAQHRWVAACGPDAGLLLLDSRDGQLRKLLEVPSGLTCVALSPDGLSLAAAGGDKVVRVWDIAAGHLRQTLSGMGGTMACLAFSSDSRCLVAGSSDRTMRVWNLATGACLQELAVHHGPVHGCCFVPGRMEVVSASWDRTVVLSSVTEGAVVHRLRGHEEGVTAVTTDAAGTLLVSASWDGTVRLWDAVSGSLLKVLRDHAAPVSALSLCGSRLASGSRDGALRLWPLS